MLGPFKQNCADCGYNSDPSCHPDYMTPAQKSSGTVAQNTTLFLANVVNGADKTAITRPAVQ
eukprot:12605338-Ditylum_brightwellii.AAC.1